MRYRALTIADQELDDAASYYEAERPGTGARLIDAYGRCLERACKLPRTGRLIMRHADQACDVRSYLVGDGFPYTVFGAVFLDEIVVLAVAHQHREPGYWVERLPEAR